MRVRNADKQHLRELKVGKGSTIVDQGCGSLIQRGTLSLRVTFQVSCPETLARAVRSRSAHRSVSHSVSHRYYWFHRMDIFELQQLVKK